MRCAHKTGVDPNPRSEGNGWTLHKKTSDDFFVTNQRKFDIVFIDGLHLAEQVLKDIFNSLAVLRPNGIILVHDCNPLTENSQYRNACADLNVGWHGDVWKAIAYIREFVPMLFCSVIKCDQGIGVILPRDQERVPCYTSNMESKAKKFIETVTWKDLDRERDRFLGLIENLDSLEGELRRQGLGCR